MHSAFVRWVKYTYSSTTILFERGRRRSQLDRFVSSNILPATLRIASLGKIVSHWCVYARVRRCSRLLNGESSDEWVRLKKIFRWNPPSISITLSLRLSTSSVGYFLTGKPNSTWNNQDQRFQPGRPMRSSARICFSLMSLMKIISGKCTLLSCSRRLIVSTLASSCSDNTL